MEKVLRVAVRLRFEQPADPGELLLVPDLDAVRSGLVLPVRRDAVFGSLVHVPGADLDLEGDALRADDGRVDGLVAVGLRGGDIVLETARQGLEHVVDVAEDVVAVGNALDDHAEGAEVENFVELLVLRIHLAVDGIDVLDSTGNFALNVPVVEPGLNLVLDGLHEFFEHGHVLLEGVRDFLEADGVEIEQREVLQLPLGLLHAEAVGDRSVDFHRFKGLGALLFRRLVLHRPHVVEAVGDLDHDDADVLRHGDEHLAHVLHLLVLFAGVLDARELGDAFDEVRDRRAELLGDVLIGQRGVLDRIVQEGGDDAVLVREPHFDAVLRRGDAVGHIGRALAPLLPAVGEDRAVVGRADAPGVHRRVHRKNTFFKRGIHLVRVEIFRFIRFVVRHMGHPRSSVFSVLCERAAPEAGEKAGICELGLASVVRGGAADAAVPGLEVHELEFF